MHGGLDHAPQENWSVPTLTECNQLPSHLSFGILMGYREQLKLQKNKHPEDRTVQNQAQYTGTKSQRSGV